MLLLLLQMVVGGELFEMNRRAAHPHMNNLVYGRRSAPSTASDAVVVHSIMTICAAIYSNICVAACGDMG